MQAGLAKLPSRIKAKPRARIDLEATPELFLKHEGQLRAWACKAQEVAVTAGWQSGKTVIGPPWMLREISRTKATEYGLVNANYPLLDKKQQPEMDAYLKKMGIGRWEAGKRRWVISAEEARAIGRNCKITINTHTADKPQSLESATYGAVWFDESGQCDEASYHAIKARLAVNQGRLLHTSRPYKFNWFKRLVWDRSDGKNIQRINFKSKDNPAFSDEEYEAAKTRMPLWMFQMRYDGIFTRPAGSVYDCFGDEHKKALPGPGFERSGVPIIRRAHIGVDFGSANTAAVVVVEDHPDSEKHPVYYVTATYHKGTSKGEEGGSTDVPDGEAKAKDTEGVVKEIKALAKGMKIVGAWGGTWSEDEPRVDFSMAGLDVNRPPRREVETGIRCVYAMLAQGRLFVDPSLSKILQEFESYVYETDDEGQALDEIEKKARFHRLDALRYVCMGIAASEDWGEEIFYGGRAA